jgi:tRNA threonylcarbamoyladenosine biosynthesis protein TsaB
MMLAFDTATDRLTVALGTPDRIIAEINEDAPRAHLGRLLPAIDEVIKKAKVDLAGIDHLAVGIGPGSFTALRIAISTAQSLAHALDRPLVGVSTLDIVAAQLAQSLPATSEAGSLIYPVLDAKRREVYTAGYDSQGRRLTDYQVLHPEQLAKNLTALSAPVVLGGDGLTYSSVFAGTAETNVFFADQSLWAPRASVLIGLAKDKIDKGEVEPYFAVLPMYIRLPDAKEASRRERSF